MNRAGSKGSIDAHFSTYRRRLRNRAMNNAELQQRKDAATPRGVGVMCQFYAERALNGELWDVEDRRYIDFAAGIAVLNTGHRHPKIVAAIEQQLGKFT